HLEQTFGIGCHTISVPRLEQASGSDCARHPPHPVSDSDFKKLIAILRLTIPYTGIIMSTRETAHMRRETFELGVSQISAGSCTRPGGYSNADKPNDSSQFALGDHRSLDAVINDVANLGYIPSFCTACYRTGRTGHDFMDLAKPGDIKHFCEPNALASFAEYLHDYATPETRSIGETALNQVLGTMNKKDTHQASRMIAQVKSGKRDVFI
ncbi:MAG: [FeFe] hydrogenase H-cluster radical SAM maturase HydG, partial [Deltaproteobacteria bacterium]|nr:[FeFe] hydrogenase H-cluster radical SAM maturase HydG [Deltaproteobacteria bacterium]